jgi:uncharacterized protein YdaU (DUF1376 family)
MKRGHNGGPPLVETDVPDLTYVKFYPADFLTGTMHLSLEQRGAYITALCVMYDRMSGFPFDEKEGAMLLRVDKRVYRRVRDDLLADGKFYRDGDVIRNRRVEDEIKSYISEYLRRSAAAQEREARRRLHRTSGELPANLQPTSPELRPEVPNKSAELEAKNVTKTTVRASQEHHIPEARSQKLEARIEEREDTPKAPKPNEGGGGGLRPGEEALPHGVFVNCQTVRHKAFSISIESVAMQLATASGLGLTVEEARAHAKQSSVAHALQWALEIENGKLSGDVVPKQIANFIRGSVASQLTKTNYRKPVGATASGETPEQRKKRLFAQAQDEMRGRK